MASKAGITVAIKGEIDDLEAKISQSKEIINDATKSIISENNKLIASQEALNRIQKTYSKEIDNANNEIKKYLELKSQNGKLTKEEQQNLAAARAELALYKTKTKELTDVERERQKEIKRNIAITRDMQNLQRASINDARTEIETKRKVIELEKQSIASKNNLEKSTSNLANTTIRYLRWAGTIAGAVYAGKRAWDATIGSGIAVNRMIEDNTAGIAALLTANTRMTLSNGKVVDSYEKFRIGGEKATEIMDKIRVASIKTYATFPQLTEIYQQAIGQTLSMGTSFGTTVDEISDNTIKLAQRMSNIGGAIGQPMDRIKEEIRSLISGNASTDSIISTMIFGSPSQANEAIRKAKELGVNGLRDMLEAYLKTYDVLEGVRTYTRSQLELQDAIQQTQKVISEPSFNALKDIYAELAIVLNDNRDKFKQWGINFVEIVKLIVEYADDVLVALAAWKIIPSLLKNVNISLLDVKNATSSWGNATIVASGIGDKFSSTIGKMGASLKSLVVANGPFLLAMAAYEGYNYLIGQTVEKEEALNKIRNKTKEDLYKLSTAQLEYNKLLLEESLVQKEHDAWKTRVDAGNYKSKNKLTDLSKEQQIEQARLNAQAEIAKQDYDSTKQQLSDIKDIQAARESILSNTKKTGELQTRYARDKALEEEAVKFIKKNEEETVSLLKEKQKAISYLSLKEKELSEIKTKYAGDTEAEKDVQDSISKTKGYILGLDKKIAEESQKNSDKTISKLKSENSEKEKENKLYAEHKAVQLELAMLRSGEIDEERLKISLLELQIQRREEEARYRNEGLEKDKLLVQIERDKLNLKKLQNDEEEKKAKQYKFDQVSGLIKYTDMQNLGEIYQELKVYYKEDPESLSDLEKWVEKEQNKLNKKPLTLQINLEGWDDISNSIATFGNSFQKIDKAQKKYQRENEKIIKDEVELEQARIDLVDTTISGYGDMIGAIGSFYDEDDERRKKQLELQKVFSAAKMAMQVAELAQSTAFTSLFVAQETTKGAAAGATAVAVAAQSSPWTGFITAAAMAALLASFGIMIGGKTKTTTVDMTMPVNDGKGSVLGDPMAQSKSIANSLEILEDFASPQFRVLSEMNKNVKTIADSIGGVASLLIKQGGFAFGEGFTPTSTTKQNIKINNDIANAIVGGGVGLVLSKLKIPIISDIAGMFGGLINSALGGLFGKTTVKKTMTDSGIYFANQLLTNAIEDFNGSAYQTIQTTVKKKSWFSSSSSTTTTDYFQALDNEITRQFSLVLGGLYDTALQAGTALDMTAEDTEKKLSKFVVSIGKISLKGKTGEQIQESLTNVFGKAGDQIALEMFNVYDTVTEKVAVYEKLRVGRFGKKKDVLVGYKDVTTTKVVGNTLVPFQQVGEGLFQTMTRVATGMEEARYYIDRLGKSFNDLSYTDILNKQGNVGFEALLQSITAVEEKLYPVNNGLLTIVSGLNATAEELYGMYLSLDNLREAFKFLKVDVQAVSYATIRGAGSLEALVSGVDSYIENFLTEEERLEYSITMLKKEFGKLNIEMPTSKKGFKDLLASLDLTTEAGQELYGRLIILSEGFSDVVDESEKVYDKTISRISNIQNAFLDMIALLDNTINALLGRQTGNQTTDATIANYLTKREQVDILLGKGSNISESELETLNGLVSELATMASTIQSGFDDNTNITTNLVKDLALIKSKLKYTNQFVETDIKKQEGTILKGFSTGGYTGNGATDEIKGYVHGNEWVVNSAQVNAIGGPDAVKNMVQKEIIQKNTKIQTTKLEYSNNKSDIIDKVMTGQDIIINGFNAILSKIDEIIDYNEERREQKHSVLVSGTVNIGG